MILTRMDDEGEWMPYHFAAERLDVRSVEVGVLDVVEQGIAPVQSVGVVVDAQSVRPSQQGCPKHDLPGSIEIRPADVRRPLPFREEYEAERRRS